MAKYSNRHDYERNKAIEQAVAKEFDYNLPIPQWDKAVMLSIARDRGYRTESALVYAMHEAFGLPYNSVKHLIDTGRMTWGHVLCIGAFLEMTPREFCDTFLHDFFKEVNTNVFRAHVDEYKPLLQRPKR